MRSFRWRAPVAGLVLAGVTVFAAMAASAHVRVTPAESKPGTTESYKVSVPTEGKVATTKVELVLPQGVELVSVDDAGKPYDVRKGEAGRSIITWTTEIPPGWARIYGFTARNPKGSAELSWKAHQFFADGTTADWVDVPGSKRPASVTKLVAAP